MSFSWDKASRDCLATNGVPRFIQRYPISKSGSPPKLHIDTISNAG
jgi:hypothetical protein